MLLRSCTVICSSPSSLVLNFGSHVVLQRATHNAKACILPKERPIWMRTRLREGVLVELSIHRSNDTREKETGRRVRSHRLRLASVTMFLCIPLFQYLLRWRDCLQSADA
ncbi:uncharacterized protein LAESUDRAFT_422876 [Laetiporus sulphureus 93-53]|uniref:Uncharacterized protein n=1 Tax=Laetiporus sulphureus 93-53 TaxID=1314785 RepID=A0A165GHX6_9APHY|nr:uncharacterized protein LAESUDRAFT_422876 [Laetiporus sulphureus 93-53]KZT10373.1 hypothetical protein LAESUDRAFT_422876 [Laetiporus sulphureus 93-53]